MRSRPKPPPDDHAALATYYGERSDWAARWTLRFAIVSVVGFSIDAVARVLQALGVG